MDCIFLLLISTLAALLAGGCAPQSPGAGGTAAAGSNAGRRTLPAADVVATDGELLPIAVHYVAFNDGNGAPVERQSAAETLLKQMSSVWAQCHIGFRLERYDELDAGALGARYSPANYAELDSMKERDQGDDALLIIGTGPWDRSGDLGSTGSNCFSSFPGDAAQGIACEQAQVNNPMLLSHEVGHWFNLLHTDDPGSDGVDDTTAADTSLNLMKHLVAPENTQLTPGQCVRARRAIATSRTKAVLNL